ncbi:hypothetical protein TNCV_3062731 [Trichonephila clavipes]|nr:hypothetical protein TNCV_3062731 [Trichonephila clavipes]
MKIHRLGPGSNPQPLGQNASDKPTTPPSKKKGFPSKSLLPVTILVTGAPTLKQSALSGTPETSLRFGAHTAFQNRFSCISFYTRQVFSGTEIELKARRLRARGVVLVT